jgi:imidazolonepropionase-like amidohydrolase
MRNLRGPSSFVSLLAGVCGFVAALGSEPGMAAGPVAYPTETVIRAGALIDPATGDIRRNLRIVIRDRRIAAIEPARADEPAASGELDLRRAYIVPGLMDTHVHLGMASIPEEKQSESDAWLVLRAQRIAGEMLRAGFTTVRDLGNEQRLTCSPTCAVPSIRAGSPRRRSSTPDA